MPIFSVIIPTYNSEKFIENTIQSVLDQTFKDFELIIVDDGSKDNTRQIISEFKKKDPRIKTIITPNSGGPATPTNIGINVAQGKYLVFLDHDDSWKKDKLELLYKIYTNNDDIGFILSDVEIYDENENKYTITKAPTHNDKLSNENLLAGNYFNTFSMLSIKKNVLERIGSIDTNLLIFSDYDIIARMVSYNIPHYFIGEPLATYRIHQHNASSLSSSALRRTQDLERIITKYSKTFEMYPKSLSAVHHAIARIHLYLGNKGKSVHHFKKAVSYDKKNYFMYVRLAFAYLGEKPYRSFNVIKNKALRNIS